MSDALPLPPRPRLEQYKKLREICSARARLEPLTRSTMGDTNGLDDRALRGEPDQSRTIPACAVKSSASNGDGTSSAARRHVAIAACWPTRNSSSPESTDSRAGRSSPHTSGRCRGATRRSPTSRPPPTRSSPATSRRCAHCCANIPELARAAIDARASFDAPPLRFGQRRRRLPPESRPLTSSRSPSCCSTMAPT